MKKLSHIFCFWEKIEKRDFFGGGGGSRTPVRTVSASGIYMLSPIFSCFAELRPDRAGCNPAIGKGLGLASAEKCQTEPAN